MVAESMHRAREEDIPFSAFSCVRVMADGNFSVYNYEAPSPVLICQGIAQVMKPRLYTVGYEVIGESFGTLDEGDSVMIFSDGVTQAGLGHGYTFGIGEEGVVELVNRGYASGKSNDDILDELLGQTYDVSGGRHADDTTAVILSCRKANQLTILTGPPSQRSDDPVIVSRLMDEPGLHVVCGSTTSDIVSRELGKPVTFLPIRNNIPPEYLIEGLDMVTEGAIMLNQVSNIIGLPVSMYTENTVVERLARFMLDSDVITFIIGGAINEAHTSITFERVGIRTRSQILKLLIDKLRAMGKLVITVKF